MDVLERRKLEALLNQYESKKERNDKLPFEKDVKVRKSLEHIRKDAAAAAELLEDFRLSEGFYTGSLRKTSLAEANLAGFDLARADFAYSNFTQANLASTNLRSSNLRNAILFKADLTEADLSHADLSYADLRHSDLTRANLSHADLTNAKLSHSNLAQAILIYSKCRNTSLFAANLINSDLRATDFTFSDLRYTSIYDALCGYTTFADTDLSFIKGLNTIIHYGPSSISIDTILRSKNIISHDFLSACGLSNNMIDILHNLSYMEKQREQRMIYPSCFISYSTKDEEFATHIHTKLRTNDVAVWFASYDIQGGRKIFEQVDSAIQRHDKMIIILSTHSMNSEWVKTELRRAIKYERDNNKRLLFPIRLCNMESIQNWTCFDADWGKDLAIEVREYFIPDFSSWQNNDLFEKAFARLMHDLKKISEEEQKENSTPV